ncbi:unnamed protein product [Brassica oleracea]
MLSYKNTSKLTLSLLLLIKKFLQVLRFSLCELFY